MKQMGGTIVKGSEKIVLKLAPDGKSMEGRISSGVPPAKLAANVRFKREGPDYHFDFNFPGLTEDNSAASGPLAIPVPMQPIEIPEKTSEIVALLNSRTREIQQLVEKGAFGEIYVPAFQVKDLALALDVRSKEIGLQQRPALTLATERVVRLAWQLDAYGDQGDGDRIREAYAALASAVQEIETLFSPRRP